eukprot:m.49572 g.49572  ORF g.49572 m.49572 type:complete len:110 (+) comp34014_c0_seq1:356-685(+)
MAPLYPLLAAGKSIKELERQFTVVQQLETEAKEQAKRIALLESATGNFSPGLDVLSSINCSLSSRASTPCPLEVGPASDNERDRLIEENETLKGKLTELERMNHYLQEV